MRLRYLEFDNALQTALFMMFLMGVIAVASIGLGYYLIEPEQKKEEVGTKMEAYLSVKLILGEPMTAGEFRDLDIPAEQEKALLSAVTWDDDAEGYHVVYPGGYHSWSPPKAFENSHRLITEGEIGLFDLLNILEENTSQPTEGELQNAN
jgi:hypothetical protein